MLRRLTALVFILALAGGALAGTPLHVCGHECDMHKAADMEMAGCPGSHAASVEAPETALQALCCTNCWQPGQTLAPALSKRQAPQPVSADQHPSPVPPQAFVPVAKHDLYSTRGHPPSSKPTFIRHHALLI